VINSRARPECSPFVTRLEVWVQFIWVIHLHQGVTSPLAV